jgi:glycosyltransferase involved in cell wall biosynthesis
VKIAVVAPLVTAIAEPQIGGSQALVSDIATGLARRGHDVWVYAASGSHIEDVRTVETGVDPDDMRKTLFRAGDEHGASEAAGPAFAHVYDLVGAEAFDVVHNHAFDVPAIDRAPTDVPVVHTLHLPPADAIAEALRSARTRSRSLAIAAVSRFGAATWQAKVDVDVVLPNGVPIDRIAFSRSAGPGVLFAGRLSPEKGVEEAIDIARRLALDITVAGPIYDERYVEERIMPLVSGHVHMIGALARPDLWRLMGEARATLCPAMWDEPFGLVAAESLAAGTPVIAFARGALGEVVRDGETGALVDDVDGAVDALRDLAVDRAECRRYAERTLSIERTLDAHEALYRRLA